jgi:hypothetical protein
MRPRQGETKDDVTDYGNTISSERGQCPWHDTMLLAILDGPLVGKFYCALCAAEKRTIEPATADLQAQLATVTARAEAAESRLREMRWQPIETAPKDGSEVLLLFPSETKRTGYWARLREAWSVDAVVAMPMPTHWAPLPSPHSHQRSRR